VATGEGGFRMVPTFTSRPIDGGGAQLFPCNLGHGYAAGFLRGLQMDGHSVHPEPAAGYFDDRPAAARPQSTRFRAGVPCLRGFHHWFRPTCTVPSRLPDPGRLAVPTRSVVVGAAPT